MQVLAFRICPFPKLSLFYPFIYESSHTVNDEASIRRYLIQQLSDVPNTKSLGAILQDFCDERTKSVCVCVCVCEHRIENRWGLGASLLASGVQCPHSTVARTASSHHDDVAAQSARAPGDGDGDGDGDGNNGKKAGDGDVIMIHGDGMAMR